MQRGIYVLFASISLLQFTVDIGHTIRDTLVFEPSPPRCSRQI